MSFLAGRLAGKEGAFFFEESKHAVTRLAQKIKPSNSIAAVKNQELAASPDVLPEILRHSLPSKIFQSHTSADSSLSGASKWALPTDPNKTTCVSPDALNPLRAYVSLPQVTFGPKRWQLPSAENSVQASTANDLRRDRYTPLNPEKLKAAAMGMSQIAKAFAAATALVFGGSALTFSLAASKLELHNSDDIRTKGKDIVQPILETFKEQLSPLRIWAEEKSKKWRLEKGEDVKEKPLVKELSKILGAR
ncbi:uncharacterized protein LOC107793807 [Nicotiana tabacum]|uniref:Uncharacterized protein LOC107793807 n=1 Tax=Nicotiana tabacum TaxID=4097 RepID=A0A1S4A547_TOBAC|nr:uncharacterized protein LOC104115381 [Nicotiana tomentosiformis]XP_016471730.1 PREDICTED: uncharacterized protein LOC107793807 [Nicotiana tabacum]